MISVNKFIATNTINCCTFSAQTLARLTITNIATDLISLDKFLTISNHKDH